MEFFLFIWLGFFLDKFGWNLKHVIEFTFNRIMAQNLKEVVLFKLKKVFGRWAEQNESNVLIHSTWFTPLVVEQKYIIFNLMFNFLNKSNIKENSYAHTI